MDIPLSSVSLTDRERAYAFDAINTGWISSSGAYVKRFEDALSARVGRSQVIACTNGTLALEIVLRAIGLQRGDEVIVPALTFVAPAAVVKALGGVPVLADIDPQTWTLDPSSVMERVTPRTKAVIAVDLLGHPADYDALVPTLSAYGIFVIEDAAEAHGASYKGKQVGSFGVASCFSFHANKTISTGEGGCVATHHERLAKQVRLLVNHGMTPDRPYWHDVVGTNARMTNITAAIGVGQVERWDELVEARQRVARWYDERLPVELKRRPVAAWATEATWLYTVTHPERDRIVAHLRSRGIDARALWTALCDLPLYGDGTPCPVARRVAREAFWLPTFADLTLAQVETVIDALYEALKAAA